jgi:uncharacterized membrane protein YjdF
MTAPALANDELMEPATPTRDTALRTIAVCASVLFILVSAAAKIPTYRINPIFLIPMMWAPYWLRRRLFLHPVPYAMFGVAILLHDLGAYGLYRASPLPFSYDILVHYYFAVPVTLLLYRALAGNFPMLRWWQVAITSLLFMMGFGALHEIMEFMTYLVLGEKNGMLKPATSYFFDTQRDLTNNLLGTLTALLLVAIVSAARRRASGRAT